VAATVSQPASAQEVRVDTQQTSPRPKPVTSGSDTRPPRPLRRPVLVDVGDEAVTLLEEPEWTSGDRNSRTLATSDRLRIVLTALRAGAELGNEESNDTLAVQTLRGGLQLTVDGMDLELRAGQLATVEEPREWRLRATSDALLLLTVGLGTRPTRT
jgi:quercetin dioxygenase-like cupin family protein